MSAIFILKKEPPKKHQIFLFLNSRYFVMGGPIDKNVDAFWEAPLEFLKSIAF